MSLTFFKDDQISTDESTANTHRLSAAETKTYAGFAQPAAGLFARSSATGILAVTVGCADNNSWFRQQAIETSRF